MSLTVARSPQVKFHDQPSIRSDAGHAEGSSYHAQKCADLILGCGGIYLVIPLSDLENLSKLPPRCFPTTQIWVSNGGQLIVVFLYLFR